MCGPKCITAHAMASPSRCVVLYTRSSLVSDRDKCPISFVVISEFSSKNTHPTLTSQASAFSVIRTSTYGNAKTGGEVIISWRLFIASGSFPFSSKLNGRSFRSLSLSGNAIFAKISTNRVKTLQRPRNDINSITFRGALSPLMHSSYAT